VSTPALTHLNSEQEYRKLFIQEYCSGPVVCADGIEIYFSRSRFNHAFYESSQRDGVKDQFSVERSTRIGWIRETLENPGATLFKGWDPRAKAYNSSRRVAVVYQEFVVVVRLRISQSGGLKGDFVTCYLADNSIGKIRQSPLWDKGDCLKELGP
jgi:hypothetical protein